MNRTAKTYVGVVIAAGVAASLLASLYWESIELWRCLLYVLVSALAGPIKLRLPGMEGTYSPSGLLGLMGVVYCAFPEAVLGALAGALTGSLLFTKKRPAAAQVAFNLANVALTIAACRGVLHGLESIGVASVTPVALTAIAATHFVVNTMVVSGILALVTDKPFSDVASSWYVDCFPYFLGGAALLVLVPASGETVPVQAWPFAMAILYLVHFFVTVRSHGSEATPVKGVQNWLSPAAWLFVVSVFAGGFALILRSIVQFETQDSLRFTSYLFASALLARLKVKLPGLMSTISLHYVVKLVALMTLSLPEALLVAATGALAQSNFERIDKLRVERIGFNVGVGVLSTFIAFHGARWLNESALAALGVATILMYSASTLLVGIVVCFTEGRRLDWAVRQLWSWSLPYYMAGAAAAGLIVQASGQAGWMASMAMLPLLVLMFVSYRLHLRA
ncbi:MAG: hypothetical protein JNN08_30735 [Bryobacterales bacterium]|nr:hypothetical protein [Bryobacterales bacterium]